MYIYSPKSIQVCDNIPELTLYFNVKNPWSIIS